MGKRRELLTFRWQECGRKLLKYDPHWLRLKYANASEVSIFEVKVNCGEPKSERWKSIRESRVFHAFRFWTETDGNLMKTCLITIQHFSAFLLDVKLINREIWNFLCCSVFDSRFLFIFRSARFCWKPIPAGLTWSSHFKMCCYCESDTLWCMFTLETTWWWVVGRMRLLTDFEPSTLVCFYFLYRSKASRSKSKFTRNL